MPEIYAHPGRYTTPERGTEMGRTWVRSQAAVDVEPGPAADSDLSPPVISAGEPLDPADRAPVLPHTPPMLDDVNLVTVAEHEYVPTDATDPTHGSRLLAQVRRSWAVSRRRATG